MAVINGVTMKCSLCAAWDKDTKQNQYAECHKTTPVCHPSHTSSRCGEWPITKNDDYCLGFVAET